MRNFCALLVATVMTAGLILTPGQAATPKAKGRYAGYVVVDAASGNVVLEENADVLNPPASMTKLMTFAVLSDKLASGSLTLQTMVQIDISDSREGGTQVYLDPRETFSVEDLTYAMMIQSANDAAHALARVAGGSVENFIVLMNAKARELGMSKTTFRTVNGLTPSTRKISEGDVTTPRDFSLLCRYLVTHTDVLKYSSVKERDFGMGRKKGPQHMINHNKLLGRVTGVDGLKTGYTTNAGYCLSFTAERGGRRVIGVIMGAFGAGGAVDRGVSRDLKTVELIEKAFASLPALPAGASPAIPAVLPTSHRDRAIPTITTDASSEEEQSSTGAEPMFKFSVPSSEKK